MWFTFYFCYNLLSELQRCELSLLSKLFCFNIYFYLITPPSPSAPVSFLFWLPNLSTAWLSLPLSRPRQLLGHCNVLVAAWSNIAALQALHNNRKDYLVLEQSLEWILRTPCGLWDLINQLKPLTERINQAHRPQNSLSLLCLEMCVIEMQQNNADLCSALKVLWAADMSEGWASSAKHSFLISSIKTEKIKNLLSSLLVTCRWRPVSWNVSSYLHKLGINTDSEIFILFCLGGVGHLMWFSSLLYRESESLQLRADSFWRYRACKPFKAVTEQHLTSAAWSGVCLGFNNTFTALQSKLLKKAASMLVAELEQKKEEKERVVSECFPPLKLSGMSVQELQVEWKKKCKITPIHS